MASLLTDPLFEKSGRGPPPNKNFYHFAITKSGVIWRWWKISPRIVDRYSKPGEVKESHQDFLDDTVLQSEISMVFGRRILQYTKALCQDHYDYLERLSDSILLRIINDLELEDVGQLRRTSHRFRELCGSEKFWEQAVHRRCNTVSPEVASLALEVGWRSVFFTSKLQLQKLISRRRLKAEEPPEGQLSDPDIKAEESPGDSSEIDQASGSEKESPPGIIPKLSLGTDPGAGFDHSFYCDVDSESDLELAPTPANCLRKQENPVWKQLRQNNSRGDFRAEPDKP
ncbi:F-box only protein 36b isoform X2 [Pseudochaenichthys georgianus]|uniref:F-box only protein 36b isoform X2 n=1 Tax=Pseudochaenichthys georgianus TaxID=52239 RepID=UPI00146A76BF|nr:F-box only protein 36b isoform X2 [Pseudochaenichthys georgianus]